MKTAQVLVLFRIKGNGKYFFLNLHMNNEGNGSK